MFMSSDYDTKKKKSTAAIIVAQIQINNEGHC